MRCATERDEEEEASASSSFESIPSRYRLDTVSMGDVDARGRPRGATNHRHRHRDGTARGTTTRVEEDGSGREERRVKRVKRAGEVMRETSVIGASTLMRGGTWGTSRSSTRDVELAGSDGSAARPTRLALYPLTKRAPRAGPGGPMGIVWA